MIHILHDTIFDSQRHKRCRHLGLKFEISEDKIN